MKRWQRIKSRLWLYESEQDRETGAIETISKPLRNITLRIATFWRLHWQFLIGTAVQLVLAYLLYVQVELMKLSP